MAIELTERAAQEIKRILAQRDLSADATYLRFGVKGGGCGGFTYLLDLTDTGGEHDEHFVSHGVRLVCDAESYRCLRGTTLDFRDEVVNRGFVFNNPNATNSCSCGSSFSPGCD